MRKFQVFGASSPQESNREIAHRALARRAAEESFVLLKNDGVLPLPPGKIALYGPGSRRTVKGGSGSGDVRERYSVTIEEGLKNAGFSFPTTLWMDRFERKYQSDIAAWRAQVEQIAKTYSPVRTMDMFLKIGEYPKPYPSCTPVRADELTDETDTAIYVLSRQAGEGCDRRVEKGDYLLSDVEREGLRVLSEHYNKLILVLNCGGIIDLSVLEEMRVDAVMFYGQGGMEGGNALADVLTGSVIPCGKLTDTWAYQYSDYPSADTFGNRNGDLENEEYSEGIYVGYRWFDQHNILPRYPFGYGLSYTEFYTECQGFSCDGTKIKVHISVENTGSRYAGKEIVQVYLQKPGGALDCEKRSLAAFAKTKVLAPGEREMLELCFDLTELASFDEAENAFMLYPGEYIAALSDGRSCGTATLEKKLVLKRKQYKEKPFSTKVQRILSRLSDKEKIMLVVGGGYPLRAYNNVMGAAGRTCTKLLGRRIPNIVMSDGPAGLNVVPVTAVGPEGLPRYPEGLPEDWRWGWLNKTEKLFKAIPGKQRKLYRYMTAWPCASLLSCSWDTALMEEVGAAVGQEMREIGVSVWLAPGMNIHRNPLCGRHFEYYSEDPLVAGKMGAAITRGVQSAGGVGVSVKHFCCNNQEDNRTGVSANVSERALREIYLRAFRIAVTEGKPWTVMSSYNRVNGRYVCNDRRLLTDILRGEWGFDGLVMSDWNAVDQCSCAEAINAGNDLIMPGSKAAQKKLEASLKDGTLEMVSLETSAGRVLELIFKSETCKEFADEKAGL